MNEISMSEINISRLSEEINEFSKYMEPTKFEIKARDRVFTKIRNHIVQQLPGAEVYLFGSCKTELLLPSSDINIGVRCPSRPDLSNPMIMTAICHKLRSQGFSFNKKRVAQGVFPRLKCVDKKNQILVEIVTLPNSSASTIEWMKEYPELKPLFLIIKHSLMGVQLERPPDNAATGPTSSDVPSYIIICLIAHYLKYNENAKRFVNPVTRLGNLLLGLLKFYSTCDFKKTGWTFNNDSGFFDVAANKKHRIVIEDSERPDRYVVQYNITAPQFQAALAWMHGQIQSLIDSNEFQRSMLSCIITVTPHSPDVQRKSLSNYQFQLKLLKKEDLSVHCLPELIELLDQPTSNKKKRKMPEDEEETDDQKHHKKT